MTIRQCANCHSKSKHQGIGEITEWVPGVDYDVGNHQGWFPEEGKALFFKSAKLARLKVKKGRKRGGKQEGPGVRENMIH